MANIQSDKATAPARDTAGSRLAAKRAAKAAKKASQRGTATPLDDVQKSVRVVNAWFDEHGRKVWIGLGAIALIAIAWYAVERHREQRDRDAGEILNAAIATSAGLIVPADETPPEDPIFPTFSSLKEREQKALQQFDEVEQKFPDSRPAQYAQLGRANAQLQLGKFAGASTSFDKLLTQAGDDTFLRFRGLEGAGYALEGQKKYAEAGKRFAELSKLGSGEFRTIGDYHQARMLVLQDQRAQARKLLELWSKASADKPEEQGERFEGVAQSAQTLLSELGGQPAEKSGGKSGISQHVLDALRKQIATQKQ
ncbi:MAG TPA: tetratricopeptide repeat protein [Polyangiales bacterium]|nr:tetratricopeptide repeat protein [Polyangiales bacterium]